MVWAFFKWISLSSLCNEFNADNLHQIFRKSLYWTLISQSWGAFLMSVRWNSSFTFIRSTFRSKEILLTIINRVVSLMEKSASFQHHYLHQVWCFDSIHHCGYWDCRTHPYYFLWSHWTYNSNHRKRTQYQSESRDLEVFLILYLGAKHEKTTLTSLPCWDHPWCWNFFIVT